MLVIKTNCLRFHAKLYAHLAKENLILVIKSAYPRSTILKCLARLRMLSRCLQHQLTLDHIPFYRIATADRSVRTRMGRRGWRYRALRQRQIDNSPRFLFSALLDLSRTESVDR